jgi:hypothetical protein
MDPTITKASTGKERLVAACAESQSTSRGPNRPRFLAVQAAIRAKMQCDKKTLLAEADASKKRNLIWVGGYADNAVDLCGEGNADAKRQCLGKGQTMLTKPPSQAAFEECWSEAIIKNGLSPSLVDDPLFRKALVTTARMGQSAVCMGKGTALGKRDTTLPHRVTFSTKIIPATDKRLDEEGMARLKPRMKKVGGTLMSDGWQSTTNKPVINVILGVDGMLSLRLAADCSGQDKTMSFICDLLCNVIEQLGSSNIFSVVMDGACKGAFPLIRGKYPHIQCFTCPAHGLDGFIKNICGSKEEIQMQRNEMGGVGVQHVAWDEDFFEKAFAQAWQCIQAVTAHQKPLARFRVIAESLPANEQIAGGTEPKKYGETRYGSRVTMSERMINTKRIYEKLMLDQEYISWLDRQAAKTKEKVRLCI